MFVARNVTNINRIKKQRLMKLVAYLMDDFPLGNASKNNFHTLAIFRAFFSCLTSVTFTLFVANLDGIGMFRYIQTGAISCNTPRYFSEALYTRSSKQHRSLQSGLKFRNDEETPV